MKDFDAECFADSFAGNKQRMAIGFFAGFSITNNVGFQKVILTRNEQ
ncbi:hypothetical protein QLX67_12345 [Balneolaceae bacterium ANBcel3]|nr:hypothetical protein [Balneolaceae bacterium ANBcel3]